MDHWNPMIMAIDEVAKIPDRVFEAVGRAHGAASKECPDCESHWDREIEDRCATCGLTLDDLTARLERRAT